MKYDLVGVGKINLDVITYPKTTEKFVGGHVPNILSSAQMLGLKTAMIARVGRDDAGRECLKEFREIGIDVSNVAVDDQPTPIVDITATAKDRIIKARPARQTEYTNAHKEIIQNSSIVFIDSYTINFEECVKDCNLYGVQLASSFQHIKKSEKETIARMIYSAPDLLFANEEEAIIGEKAVNTVISNGGTVIITLGSKGCRIMKKGTTEDYPSFKPKVIDATGAGDAFAAGYLFGLVRKNTAQKPAILANAMGALAVSNKGPVLKVTIKKLEQFIESQQTQT